MNTIHFTTNEDEGDPRVPTKGYPGDAGWDLFVSRTVIVPPQSFVDVHTDIAIAMPAGFYGRIVARSSTFRDHQLVVSEGIIDNGWRGELFIGVWNPTNKEQAVVAGSRVAQLLIHQVHYMGWNPVAELAPSKRGTSGFGSTGR
jgi:dUTP pyrophosphatase